MLILGINKGFTAFGKQLKDGGAALLDDDKIIGAISEERVSKRKGDGGFSGAADYLLESFSLNKSEVDCIFYSSCCEFEPSLSKDSFPPTTSRFYVPHHLSHAHNAFYASPFEKALILVLDSGGDVLENMHSGNDWWKYRREQHSYYLGVGNKITLLERDFDGPSEVGFGETFRAFTQYLGWSTNYAGKLMSLAALTDHTSLERKCHLFHFDASFGKLKGCLINNPKNPFEMIKRLADQNNFSLGDPRNPKDEIKDIHIDIAHFVQSQYEKYLFKKINYLVKKYNITNLCISGGVGLNCVANSHAIDNTAIERIFIPPAPSDQGQSLGNAIYGCKQLQPDSRVVLDNTYLGPIINTEYSALKGLLNSQLLICQMERPAQTIAKMLYDGLIVGHFYGRSEFGPRALGHRSILASPQIIGMKDRLNKLKGREYFNPFAIAILEKEYSAYYFNSQTSSPFMTLADKVRDGKQHLISQAIHFDGTSRIQTVTEKTCMRFFQIIEAFNNLSGTPLILNTSLNSKDAPICETVEDALSAFLKMNLDCLVVENYLIVRRSNLDLEKYTTNLLMK